MDRIYKRYTIIAWFFTFNACWVLLNDFALHKLIYHRVRNSFGMMVDHSRFGAGVTMAYSFLETVISIAWFVFLALLAWTARDVYLSRRRLVTPPPPLADRIETDDGQTR